MIALRRAGVAAVAAGCVLAVASAPIAAAATEAPRYVLAYWTINTPDFQPGGNVWGGGGQTLAAFTLTDSTDLTQLQGLVPCGNHYQGDLYGNDQITAALLAPGIGVARLFGPDNPDESPAPGVTPWYITSWYSGDCAEKPTPRPFEDSTAVSDCESTVTTVRTGFYDLSFDAVANVWTENPDPTIDAETSSTVPVSAGEKSEACPVAGQLPTLADTGLEDVVNMVVLGLAAMALAFLGIIAAVSSAVINRRRERDRDEVQA